MTISFNGDSSSCSKCSSGIKSVIINTSGHLIITYDDNTIEDLGLVVGKDGNDGNNFYPDDKGFIIPDENFNTDKDIGWSYLSLVDPVSIYFKTNSSNNDISTWIYTEFGKGETGEAGKSFSITSSGTTFPTDNLIDNYTFYRTTDGTIWIYSASSSTWNGPYQFKGDTGEQGKFIIDSSGINFPDITNLEPNYTFYKTDTGYLYYVIQENTQKSWSQGIEFRGPQGIKGDKGDIGNPGSDANNIYAIKNIIDTSYENAVLVVGICPAGYMVVNIQINITTKYVEPVTDMKVRFGGTAQSEIDGTVIAPFNYFDINKSGKYIVDEINHDISQTDEILSCIFNESVNNSSTGNMEVIITIAKQLPITNIEDNI